MCSPLYYVILNLFFCQHRIRPFGSPVLLALKMPPNLAGNTYLFVILFFLYSLQWAQKSMLITPCQNLLRGNLFWPSSQIAVLYWENPTKHFHNLRAQNPPINVSQVHKIRRSTYFETWILRNVCSGNVYVFTLEKIPPLNQIFWWLKTISLIIWSVIIHDRWSVSLYALVLKISSQGTQLQICT